MIALLSETDWTGITGIVTLIILGVIIVANLLRS